MKNRIFPLILTVFLNTAILAGCWNYREVEKLTIVAGLAIDKIENEKYQITAEIVEIGGGKEVQPISKIITMEGSTIFDAVRNEISLAGKKLYWSHTKVVILSKEIAREGIIRVIDWINRDSETRSNVLIFVSKEKTAKDIFKGTGITNQIMSFELAEMAKNEKFLSKAPITELWGFVKKMQTPGIVAILPAIHLNQSSSNKSPQILGTAIFDKDKLIGFLSGEETKNLLFVLDDIKGGLLITNAINGKKQTPISLEIFKSKTKTTPVIQNNKVKFNIQINTTVAFDEISGDVKILEENKVMKLEEYAGKELKKRVENCIKHVQSSYGVDIFGFGAKLREENPNVWNQIAGRWDNGEFKDLEVNVKANVHIKGSGMLSNPVEKGHS